MSTLSQFFGGGGSSPFFANTGKTGVAVGDMVAAPTGMLTAPNWLPLRMANGDRTSYLQSAYSELVAVLPTVYRYVPGGLASSSGSLTGTAPWAGAFGAGLFAFFGTGSAGVATSPDGITWTNRGVATVTFGGTSATLPTISFTNSTFIVTDAGAAQTVLYSSPDGITWTSRTTPVGNWTEVAFGAGTWVSVSNAPGTAAVSSTAIATWTSRTLPVSQQWRSVAFGAGLFVAMSGGTSTYATSPDGVTWTSRTLPYPARDGLYNMAFNGSVFVVQVTNNFWTYQNVVLVSTDGLTWAVAPTPFSMNQSIRAVNGLFFQQVSPGYAISADGYNWALVQTQTSTGFSTNAVGLAFGAGLYIASAVSVSSDVARWTMDNTTSFHTPRVTDMVSAQTVYGTTTVIINAPVNYIRAKP